MDPEKSQMEIEKSQFEISIRKSQMEKQIEKLISKPKMEIQIENPISKSQMEISFRVSKSVNLILRLKIQKCIEISFRKCIMESQMDFQCQLDNQ